MLRQRIITAVWLAPLALAGLFGLEGGAFALFTGAIVVLAGWEWANLAGLDRGVRRWLAPAALAGIMLVMWLTGQSHALWPLVIGAVGWSINLWWVLGHPERTPQWSSTCMRLAMGGWVLLPTWVGFNLLRESGAAWLLFVLLLVWGADIGAYFVGRAFGRRKLAPSVSPGKSWEGVYGGMAVTACLAVVFALWQALSLSAAITLVLLTLAVTLISVLGDLLESMLKRHRGIKDSSALLPGHGGVLDRIDSLTAAIPVFALFFTWLVAS
ncbi:MULTISPECIES: phosphatidate cytidylyltransferase [unclassified Halomonas]|uniref:phosphatidate cytidylyltransferase n=1 Tax=unclassified Halomonas TaxID=2609666 RepID=UPI001C94498D|nr:MULTISPECIES: phosphatidate cytidylyltransferase [unclassified Halomonas]MBY5923658.1 phosphatidate cytidylyltransferase [Halomonas sp. DP4Y7-2]MBY6230700.1 phosphatidate cytidylyltransferase [Halomonas sp. DP4Y7-1]